MSIEDIILDRVKDKLFHQLYPSLRREGWNVDYVSDAIDQIIEYNKENIDNIIAHDTITLQNLEATANKIMDSILKQGFQKHEAPIPSPPTPNPQQTSPFNTRTLLQMCWGLTLNFSHNPQQQAMGAIFNDQFEQMIQVFTPSLSTNLSDPNGNFVLNLEMAISSCVRNLGFIRDTHMDYLSFNADRLNSRRQALEQIADYSSFSGSGLYSKIGSFVGFGSLADLVTKLNLNIIYIPIFAVGGIIGAFALTFLVRLYVVHTDDSWDWNMRKDQNRYWREHYKKDATNELYEFYASIIELVRRFYPQEADTIMNNDELLRLQNEPERVKNIIREQILPPDDLQWFPIIQSSATSSQSSTPTSGSDSGQGSQGQSSGQGSQGQSSGKSTTSSKGS